VFISCHNVDLLGQERFVKHELMQFMHQEELLRSKELEERKKVAVLERQRLVLLLICLIMKNAQLVWSCYCTY